MSPAPWLGLAPWLDDGDVQLYHGDVIDTLRQLPTGVAQTCVTSPPYWGLRDYGTGAWTGGDGECDHTAGRGGHLAESVASTRGGAHQVAEAQTVPFKDECGRCGARRVDSQLGLEASPDVYVERMVAVFRGVWRVLRDDGTCWINLGDSYSGGGGYAPDAPSNQTPRHRRNGGKSREYTGRTPAAGLKQKDLVGVPWRVAFALQADGWYLRSDVIWSKPNPMPESVSDRPTKSHEYLFLLAKQPKYFFDADAIREPNSEGSIERFGIEEGVGSTRAWRTTNNKRDGRTDGTKGNEAFRDHVPHGRNRRSVWTVATEPFPEAHFATYPQALIRPCILAGSRPDDTILDPFVGSGTTALVARNHGRRCIGIDLSSEYLGIAARRLQQLSLLAGVEP
jgi:DNA modification methylase